MAREDEYKEMFLAEAQGSCEELDQLLTELEKNPNNLAAIDALFRITHTLKGNAMGMGLDGIAALSHVLEDLFNVVKQGKIHLDANLFQTLFRANDVLGQLVEAIKTEEVVRYKGILTKLKVVLRKAKEQPESTNTATSGTKNTTTAPEDAVSTEIEQASIHVTQTGHKVILSDMVQVPVRKLDELMNIVGELLIEKDTLIAQRRAKDYNSSGELARLHRLTSDLQYSVMNVRLVQVGFLFNKFHRVLRDAAAVEGKQVDLVLEGTESEIDRNVLKAISDSLVHLVRNAVGHGIETSEERLKAGKPANGTVILRARSEKDSVFIEVEDDGHGIDIDKIKQKAIKKGLILETHANMISREEVLMCLFEPGFSNAEVVTEISGRGVGLDVVRMGVEAIGGKINIESKLGAGSIFTMSLPASMAVKPALLFQLSAQEFAIPLSYTEAVIALPKAEVHKINTGLVARYLNRVISVVFLADLFAMESMQDIDQQGAFFTHFDKKEEDALLEMVIVSYNHRFVGLVVDKLLQQKEIVEKKLPAPIHNVALFSGATVLGTGKMCLVLDIARIMAHLFKEKRLGLTKALGDK
ncbi:MAG: chemotaxis protein CheA [Aureispira sp.]